MTHERGAAGWGDCAVIIPWELYEAYGDLELLREQYPMMRFWTDYVERQTDASGLWQSGFQFGDWLALDGGDNGDERIGETDVYLIANAFYLNSLRLPLGAGLKGLCRFRHRSRKHLRRHHPARNGRAKGIGRRKAWCS